MSDTSFHIEIPELRAFVNRYGREADRRLMNELTTAFVRGGKHVQRAANRLIKGGESSRLAKASFVSTKVSAKQITSTISWANARSDTGFPYAAAYDGGRKAFGPVRAKALRFVVNGETVFAKHVKAFPGTRFMARGLAAAKPQVNAEVRAAVARFAAWLGSGR